MQKRFHRRFTLALRRIARIGSRLVFVGALFFLCAYAYRSAVNGHAASYFELDSVAIIGTEHLDQAALIHLIKQTSAGSTLAIDLSRVRYLVEAENWVHTARVRRKLPNQLLIYVTERDPAAVAAIDGELVVVDREGVILDSFGPTYSHLDGPIVKGLQNISREPAGVNGERMALYLRVVNELNSAENALLASISEIDVSQPNRVAVVPEDEPVPIFLGSGRFRDRYETFLSQMDVYYRLKKKHGLIEYVDVTYDRKIIFHTPEREVTG